MTEISVWCRLANQYVTDGHCANNCAAPEQRPVCWMEDGRQGVAEVVEKPMRTRTYIVTDPKELEEVRAQLTTAATSLRLLELTASGTSATVSTIGDLAVSPEGDGQADPEGKPEGVS